MRSRNEKADSRKVNIGDRTAGLEMAADGSLTIHIQPAIPFSISEDWNLITRSIVPVIYAESPVEGGSDKAGLGDNS